MGASKMAGLLFAVFLAFQQMIGTEAFSGDGNNEVTYEYAYEYEGSEQSMMNDVGNYRFTTTQVPEESEESTEMVGNGRKCFHCNSKSFTECQETGQYKQCLGDTDVCMVELRKRNGNIRKVQLGYKQELACENDKVNNFNGKWAEWQCRPWKWMRHGPSVCRQCCKKDGCGAMLLFTKEQHHLIYTTDGWQRNLNPFLLSIP